jgi:large subunit ribosomal protein L15
MRPNDLRPVPGSIHKKKRLGRGNASGHGTYAGRGLKGQKSRSGPDLRAGFEGGQIPLVRALSRLRGFNNRFRVEYEPVNVELLDRFESGSTVTVDSLRQAGIVKSGRLPVKILGDGELNVALHVEADRFSEGARAKIEAAGGSVVELRLRKVKATVEAGASERDDDDEDDDDDEKDKDEDDEDDDEETTEEAEP